VDRVKRGPEGHGEETKETSHGSAIRGRLRRLSSVTLLGGHGEVIIEHAGEEYHLRRTRNGKLILTK